MKAVYIISLFVGVVFLLASVSEYGISNLLGAISVWYGCSKLNLFYE